MVDIGQHWFPIISSIFYPLTHYIFILSLSLFLTDFINLSFPRHIYALKPIYLYLKVKFISLVQFSDPNAAAV